VLGANRDAGRADNRSVSLDRFHFASVHLGQDFEKTLVTSSWVLHRLLMKLP